MKAKNPLSQTKGILTAGWQGAKELGTNGCLRSRILRFLRFLRSIIATGCKWKKPFSGRNNRATVHESACSALSRKTQAYSCFAT